MANIFGLLVPFALILGTSAATFASTAQPPTSAPHNQANIDAKVADALYNDFLYTSQNLMLKPGDRFPDYRFRLTTGQTTTLANQRTLLFVRGPVCGSCERIYAKFKDQLAANNIKTISAITSVSDSGRIPVAEFGLTADATLPLPPLINILHVGELKPVLRNPYGLGVYLIDEKSIVRYVNFGFSVDDDNLAAAIKSIGVAYRLQGVPISHQTPLATVKWSNSALNAMFQKAKAYKASLLIVSEERCATCTGLAGELSTYFTELGKRGYGVFYISDQPIKAKSNNVVFVVGAGQELMRRFHTSFRPWTFILRRDRYVGHVQYVKTGEDANRSSDEGYRSAVLRALAYAAR